MTHQADSLRTVTTAKWRVGHVMRNPESMRQLVSQNRSSQSRVQVLKQDNIF